MGHLWLGFEGGQLTAWIQDAGFSDVRIIPLPPDPQAKGPGLFTARTISGSDGRAVERSGGRAD
jgi:hypothetical protein